MSSKGRIKFYKRLDVRMALWYTVTFLTMIILIFGFLDYRFRRNLLKEIDRLLVDEAKEIINVILKNPETLNDQLREYQKVVSDRRYYPIAFQVFNQQGNCIFSSEALPGFFFPKVSLEYVNHQKTITKTLEVPQKNSLFRLGTYPYRKNGELKYVVQTATHLRAMQETIENFRGHLFIAFFLALFFGSIGGWLLSRKSLRPIDKITETTKRITATNLSERLPLQGSDDDLDRLATTINQMMERLEESFQKLSRFTADAAHELRTPLAALKGETEVLLSRKRSSVEYQEALTNNLERLDFLTKLVNELLILSQADEGKASIKIENLNFSEQLKELYEAFTIVAMQKKINFTLSTSEEVLINGDRIKLQQLFSNLIDNAIKYTPEGGTISLIVQPGKDQVTVILNDTGIGIPSDDLPHIFDRFYRVDTSRSRLSGGVGLGLSICQWIVKAHHGTIDVKSHLHQGTTFTLTLPTQPPGIFPTIKKN
jgi:heavy metal sensor kinase